MRISDWSSDVCSSDLWARAPKPAMPPAVSSIGTPAEARSPARAERDMAARAVSVRSKYGSAGRIVCNPTMLTVVVIAGHPQNALADGAVTGAGEEKKWTPTA